MPDTSELSPTPRSTVRRAKHRAVSERERLHAVLDDGFVAHLGIISQAAPVVLPTLYARVGETVYLHGSTGAASLRTAGAGGPVCLTVTMLDGLVYARALMHQSMNYRCAVIHGNATPVRDPAEIQTALRAIVEHNMPGAWEHARRPDAKELAATAVLALPTAEASVKIRDADPGDEQADIDADRTWAGVLPVHRVFGEPVPGADMRTEHEVPEHVAGRAGRWTAH